MKRQAPYYESRFIRANDARPRAGAVDAVDTAAADGGCARRRRVGDGLRPGRCGKPRAQAAVSDRPVRLPTTTPGLHASARRPSTTGRPAARSPARADRRAGICASHRATSRRSSCSPTAATRRSFRPPRRWCAIHWPGSTAASSSTTFGSTSMAGPAASTTTGAAATRPPTRSARCAVSMRRRNRAWRSSRRTRRSVPSRCLPPRCSSCGMRGGRCRCARSSRPATPVPSTDRSAGRSVPVSTG